MVGSFFDIMGDSMYIFEEGILTLIQIDPPTAQIFFDTIISCYNFKVVIVNGRPSSLSKSDITKVLRNHKWILIILQEVKQ